LLFRIRAECINLGSNFAELGSSFIVAEVLHLAEYIAHLFADLIAHLIGDGADLILLFVDELQFLLNFIAGNQADYSAAAKEAAWPAWASGTTRSWGAARLRRLTEHGRGHAEHQTTHDH
jgi:hypothetical protein